MSRDFDTLIKVSGCKEGIVKVLEVVKYYEEERVKQYRAGEPYYMDYLEGVYVCEGKKYDHKKALRLGKIVDIEAYVEELEKGEIAIEASGPYGGFATLDEIDLYNDIAEKLDDTVEFEGCSFGVDSAGRQSLSAIFKNGQLEVDFEFDNYEDQDYYEEDEEEEGDVDFGKIIKDIKKILPLKEFKAIFMIKGKLSAEEYECIIVESMLREEYFDDTFGDKEEFEGYINDYINSDEEYMISEEDFKAGVEKIVSLGVKNYML